MRFFVKKSQKDKKSGLYLSDLHCVYVCIRVYITKTRKLDTLFIPYGATFAFNYCKH